MLSVPGTFPGLTLVIFLPCPTSSQTGLEDLFGISPQLFGSQHWLLQIYMSRPLISFLILPRTDNEERGLKTHFCLESQTSQLNEEKSRAGILLPSPQGRDYSAEFWIPVAS